MNFAEDLKRYNCSVKESRFIFINRTVKAVKNHLWPDFACKIVWLGTAAQTSSQHQ
jgi:hypothetical protein